MHVNLIVHTALCFYSLSSGTIGETIQLSTSSSIQLQHRRKLSTSPSYFEPNPMRRTIEKSCRNSQESSLVPHLLQYKSLAIVFSLIMYLYFFIGCHREISPFSCKRFTVYDIAFLYRVLIINPVKYCETALFTTPD